MELGTWVADLIQSQGIAVVLVLGGLWFLVARLWPFYTDYWYPDWSQRNETGYDVRHAEAAARAQLASSLQLACEALERITTGLHNEQV